MNQDWIELLESLNDNQVEYIIIGAFALGHHGFPRYTGDLDIFASSSFENSVKLYQALHQFGAPISGLESDFFTEAGTTLTFGVPPRRVDILNWISGVEWDDAWSDAVDGTFGSTPTKFLSIRTLKMNKLASGRPQDLADIARLPDQPTP